MGKEHFYEKVSAFLRFANFRRRAADGLRLCGHFDLIRRNPPLHRGGFLLIIFQLSKYVLG